jgi:hypothetical protein
VNNDNKLRNYRIHYAQSALWMDYLVFAKDANDARIMGEVWGHRWRAGKIESIKDEGLSIGDEEDAYPKRV